MMGKFTAKFINFIHADVRSESETKDLAVIIRTLSIVFAVYFLCISLITASIGHYYISLFVLFSLCALATSFISTYEDRTQFALFILIGILLVVSCSLTIIIGWHYMFSSVYAVAVLLIFFNLAVSSWFKIISSCCITLLLMLQSLLYPFFPKSPEIPTLPGILLTSLNTLTVMYAISFIAYHFCIKYSRSEDKILQYNRKLKRLALIDPLTELWNRRAMNEHLSKLQSANVKHGKLFSVAIVDIDYFKKVNDIYGHDAGDYVLVILSRLIMEQMHGKGHAARWGGEEFLLTFEDTSPEAAASLLEQIRCTTEEYRFHHKGNDITVTITGGLVEFDRHLGLDTIISKADERLYQGKSNGRNRIICK